MKRKLVLFCLSVIFCLSSISLCFADTQPMGVVEQPIINPQVDAGAGSIVPLSSRFIYLYDLVNTRKGTQYNKAKTKMAVYTIKHYKVYQKNVSSGAKHFKYHLYKWSWKGYVWKSGKWVYSESRSGSNRSFTDPINFLNGYLFP